MRTRPRSSHGALISLLSFLLIFGCNSQDGSPNDDDNQTGSAFVTYLGGSSTEQIRDVAIDSDGNMYVTGGSGSSDFPTTSGVYDETPNGNYDVFVAKFSPDGSLVWSTVVGGPNYDRAYAMELGPQGNIYVAGRAGDGFPTTSGALQESFGGDDSPNVLYGAQDSFVFKLTPDGTTLLWSTYAGSDGSDIARDVAVDGSGNAYIVSGVDRDHPLVTPGSFQPTRTDRAGLILKISSDGSQVIYGSHLDGSSTDGGTPSVRVDSAGYAYVLIHTQSSDMPFTAGAAQTSHGGVIDMFLAKFALDGSSLVYGTYLGGSDVEFTETHGLAIDSTGRAYVGITTKSTNMFVSGDAYQSSYAGSGGSGTGGSTNYPGDGYIVRVAVDGKSFEAGTYLGGTVGEGLEGISLENDQVYVSGGTFSSDFPTTTDGYQGSLGGMADFFAATLSAELTSLSYATFVGGGNIDYARSSLYVGGRFCIVGEAGSGFPTTTAAYQTTAQGGTTDGALAALLP